jgi:hypothetical protein
MLAARPKLFYTPDRLKLVSQYSLWSIKRPMQLFLTSKGFDT